MALMFAAVNVIFRDFGSIVQILTQFVPFTVPMMYPYTLVEKRFAVPRVADFYLLNPIAEAVLLIQRGFWIATTAGDASPARAAEPERPFPATCSPAG